MGWKKTLAKAAIATAAGALTGGVGGAIVAGGSQFGMDAATGGLKSAVGQSNVTQSKPRGSRNLPDVSLPAYVNPVSSYDEHFSVRDARMKDKWGF